MYYIFEQMEYIMRIKKSGKLRISSHEMKMYIK